MEKDKKEIIKYMSNEKIKENKKNVDILGPEFKKWPGKEFSLLADKILTKRVIAEFDDLQNFGGVDDDVIFTYREIIPEFREAAQEITLLADQIADKIVKSIEEKGDIVGRLRTLDKAVSSLRDIQNIIRNDKSLETDKNKKFMMLLLLRQIQEKIYFKIVGSQVDFQEEYEEYIKSINNNVKFSFLSLWLKFTFNILKYFPHDLSKLSEAGMWGRFLNKFRNQKGDETNNHVGLSEVMDFRNEFEPFEINMDNSDFSILVLPPKMFDEKNDVESFGLFNIVIRSRPVPTIDDLKKRSSSDGLQKGFSRTSTIPADFLERNFTREERLSLNKYEVMGEGAVYLTYNTLQRDFVIFGTETKVIDVIDDYVETGDIGEKNYYNFLNRILQTVLEKMSEVKAIKESLDTEDDKAAVELLEEETGYVNGEDLFLDEESDEEKVSDDYVGDVELIKDGSALDIKKDKKVKIPSLAGGETYRRCKNLFGDPIRVTGSHHIFEKEVDGKKKRYCIPFHGQRDVPRIYILKALKYFAIPIQDYLNA